ncbi:MAG: hypothetical protein WDW36_010183 [Sanguina aurantia]
MVGATPSTQTHPGHGMHARSHTRRAAGQAVEVSTCGIPEAPQEMHQKRDVNTGRPPRGGSGGGVDRVPRHVLTCLGCACARPPRHTMRPTLPREHPGVDDPSTAPGSTSGPVHKHHNRGASAARPGALHGAARGDVTWLPVSGPQAWLWATVCGKASSDLSRHASLAPAYVVSQQERGRRRPRPSVGRETLEGLPGACNCMPASPILPYPVPRPSRWRWPVPAASHPCGVHSSSPAVAAACLSLAGLLPVSAAPECVNMWWRPKDGQLGKQVEVSTCGIPEAPQEMHQKRDVNTGRPPRGGSGGGVDQAQVARHGSPGTFRGRGRQPGPRSLLTGSAKHPGVDDPSTAPGSTSGPVHKHHNRGASAARPGALHGAARGDVTWLPVSGPQAWLWATVCGKASSDLSRHASLAPAYVVSQQERGRRRPRPSVGRETLEGLPGACNCMPASPILPYPVPRPSRWRWPVPAASHPCGVHSSSPAVAAACLSLAGLLPVSAAPECVNMWWRPKVLRQAHPDTMHAVDSLRTSWLADSATVDDGHKCRQPNKRVRTWECGAMVRGGGHVLTCLGCACARPPRHTMRPTLPREHPGVDDPSTAPGSTSGPVHKHHNRGASAARPGALHGAARGDVTWLPVSGPQAWLWATVCGKASSDLSRHASLAPAYVVSQQERGRRRPRPSVGRETLEGLPGACNCMPASPILPYPVPRPSRRAVARPSCVASLWRPLILPCCGGCLPVPGWAATGLGCPGVCEHVVAAKRHTRDMACTPAPTRDGQLGKQVEVSTCGIPEAPQEMHQKRDVNTGRPPRGGSGGGVDQAQVARHGRPGTFRGEGATGRGQEACSQGSAKHPGVDDPSTAPGSTSGPVHKHHNRGASAARPGALHGAARGDVTWLPVSGPQAWLWATVCGKASSDLSRHASLAPAYVVSQQERGRRRPVHRLDGRRWRGCRVHATACPQAPSFHTPSPPRRGAVARPSCVASLWRPLILPCCGGCLPVPGWAATGLGCPGVCEHVVAAKRHTRDMACTPAPTRDGQLGKQVEVSTCGIPEAPQEMHQKRDVNTGRPPRGGSGGGVDQAQVARHGRPGTFRGEGATGRGQEACSQGLRAHPDTMHAVDSLRTSWLADSATVDDGHKCRQPNKRVRTWECGAMVRGGGHVLTCLGCACARPPRHTMRLTLPREHPGVDDPSTAPGSTSGPVHKHHNRGASAARPGALHGAARGDVTWLPVSGPQAWLWATVCGKASSDLSRHASLAPAYVVSQQERGRRRPRPSVGRETLEGLPGACNCMPASPILPYPVPRPSRWRWPVPAASHPCGVHSSSPAVAAACLSLAGLLPVSAAPECVNMWWRPKATADRRRMVGATPSTQTHPGHGMHARSHTRRAAGQAVEVSTCGIPEAPQEMHQKRDVNTGRPPRGGSGGGVDQAQVARHGRPGTFRGEGATGRGQEACSQGLRHGARQHIWTGAQAPQPRRKRCPARGVARGSKGDVTWLPVSGPQAWLWATVCGKASSDDLSRHASLAPKHTWSRSRTGSPQAPSIGWTGDAGGVAGCMQLHARKPHPSIPRPPPVAPGGGPSQLRRILVASTHPPLLWRLPACPWLGCYRHTRDMACTPAPTRDGQLGKQVEVSTCGIPEAPQEMHQKRDVNTGRPPRGGSGGGVDQAQVARHGRPGTFRGRGGATGPRGQEASLTGSASALHSGHGARQHIWTGAQAPQPRRKRCPARGVARGSKGDVTWLPVSGPQAWLWATVCGKASSDLSRHASLAPAYVVSQQERGRRRPRPSVGRETLEGLPGACNRMPASPILPYPHPPCPSRWRWPVPAARRILVASTHPPLLWRLPACPWLGCYRSRLPRSV